MALKLKPSRLKLQKTVQSSTMARASSNSSIQRAPRKRSISRLTVARRAKTLAFVISIRNRKTSSQTQKLYLQPKATRIVLKSPRAKRSTQTKLVLPAMPSRLLQKASTVVTLLSPLQRKTPTSMLSKSKFTSMQSKTTA